MRAEKRRTPALEESPLLPELNRALAGPRLPGLSPGDTGAAQRIWQTSLFAPVEEILSRPGKRFRARLVTLAHGLAGGSGAPAPELVSAVEVLHAGSMVIDDIEDDSSERRGGPTLHRTYGVPLAINAGNWMYFWPFALIAQAGLPAPTQAELLRRVTATLLDCHFGQALDLGAQVFELPAKEIAGMALTITTLKTGRLVELAAAMGALGAGADARRVDALAAFGEQLGVALQMLDDIGNLTGDVAPAKRHEDLRQGRTTWPWAWASQQLEPAAFRLLQAEARALHHAVSTGAADEIMSRADSLAGELRSAVGSYGRVQAGWRLDQALASLRDSCGASPLLDQLEQEIARLEVSYG